MFSVYFNLWMTYRRCVMIVDFVLECFCCSRILSQIYSWAAYLRVQTTSPTVMVATISVSVNSRVMVDGGSPPCFWINLLPSNVMTLLTLRPSKVSSSNSLPNSNEISDVLNVDDVIKVYFSPSFFNSTVGETEFPILRRTNPTPANNKKIKQTISKANSKHN